MKNVFIDTNIWLGLYRFTKDEIAQFRQLKDYINSDIKLILTDQVKDEFYRNRDSAINDTIKELVPKTIGLSELTKTYSASTKIVTLQSKTNKIIVALKEQIIKDASNFCLPTDLLIKEIFDMSTCYDCNKYYELAYLRIRNGNPPGKKGSAGDAINWETLLGEIHQNEELFFISGDEDYFSKFSASHFNPFLLEEWKNKKKSKIYYYRTLNCFFKNHMKDIKLQQTETKRELISEMNDSWSFAQTHNVVKKIMKFSSWSNDEIIGLCKAFQKNDQISAISNDIDIKNFYQSIIECANIELINNNNHIKYVIDTYKNDSATE